MPVAATVVADRAPQPYVTPREKEGDLELSKQKKKRR